MDKRYGGYDKETIEKLREMYREHDFTRFAGSTDLSGYTETQIRYFKKARESFARSWLALLPETGNKKPMKNFSDNYPIKVLEKGDGEFVAKQVAEIMSDPVRFDETLDSSSKCLKNRSRSALSSTPNA